MRESPTAVHISLSVAFGAFFVAALSMVLGFVLIEHGTSGVMSIELQVRGIKVNMYAFVPGLAFGVFGGAIAWKAIDALIKKA